MFAFNPFIILSAFNNRTKQCKLSDLKTDLIALKLSSKLVRGAYKGVTERSLLLALTPNEFNLGIIGELCEKYAQECFLFVDHDRAAFTVDRHGERTNIGQFKGVSKKVALATGNYTVSDGQFYICE